MSQVPHLLGKPGTMLAAALACKHRASFLPPTPLGGRLGVMEKESVNSGDRPPEFKR